MAKSKHRTTGNGTHRERILKYKEEVKATRKAALAASMQQILTPSALVDSEEIEQRTITTDPDPVKDDGLGHSISDNSLQDTLREFNGMVNHDKHEQIMDTFVEEAKSGN